MITTTAWVCASMAAGDLESPRLAIEFFNASNAFISFVADEDTSELFRFTRISSTHRVRH